MRNARKLFGVAAAVAAVAIAAPLPTVAGAGASQSLETFTNEPGCCLFFPDPCTGQQVVGYTLDSGWVRTTETTNGGSHVRGHTETTAELYSSDLPPWDPEFEGLGPLVGTWTLITNFEGEVGPGGQGTDGFVSTGDLVYPGGGRSHLQMTFRIVFTADGPPKLFLVKSVCGG